MTTVQLKGINKVYPDGFLAVPDLDLVIHEVGGDDDGRSCRRDQPRVHLTVRSADGALRQPVNIFVAQFLGSSLHCPPIC